MKRSEIVKLIYDTMCDNHFGQYGEFYKMADQILERIEVEGGMLPPTIELPLQYRNGKQLLAKTANQWESEDA